MRTLSGIGLVVYITFVAVAADDLDPIKVKLDKAKTGYETSTQKVRLEILDYFAKREENARKDGNKKLVDAIKTERQTYEDSGELPKALPGVFKQKFATSRAAMESAYATAIKEYTKAKKDDEASEIEKEFEAFKKGESSPATAPVRDDIVLINRLGKLAVVSDRDTRDGPMVLTGSATKEGREHLWKLVPADDGWHYVVAANGKYLDTLRSGTGNGAEGVVSAKKDSDAGRSQQWKLVPAEKGWVKLEQRTSGKCIGVDRNSPDMGMRLLIWSDQNQPAILWRVEKVKGP